MYQRKIMDRKMNQFYFALIAWVLCVITRVDAYPSNPPVQLQNVCADMNPYGHGSSPQTSQSAYTMTVSQTCYKMGDKVKVEITGDSFRGYFVQARNGQVNTNSYGKFLAYDNGQNSLSCFTGTDNAIGHTNGNDKSSTYFYWEAMVKDNVDVTFTATVVKKKTNYWMNVKPTSAMRFDPNCKETTVQIPEIAAPPAGMTVQPTGMIGQSTGKTVQPTGMIGQSTGKTVQPTETTTKLISGGMSLYNSMLLTLAVAMTAAIMFQ